MNPQDQIYVVAGSLGAFSLVLFVVVCILISRVSKLQKEIRGTGSTGYGGSGDLLEKRGFSEYKGPTLGQQRFEVQSPTSSHAQHSGLSRQHSTTGAGYNGAYQPQAPSSVVKVPNQAASAAAAGYGNSHGHGYGKSYDNAAYERDSRDVTAGGVRVLPSGSGLDHQARRHNYDNAGYY